MKQYLSVVIVFVICLLAIAGAWGWRISQKDRKIDIDDIENTEKRIQINTNKPVEIYEEKEETEDTIDVNIPSEILTFDEIKVFEGTGKNYGIVNSLMLRYMNNCASLNAEKIMDNVTINYKVALDMSRSYAKLTDPKTDVNKFINEYLKTDKTYDIEITKETEVMVNIVIKSN